MLLLLRENSGRCGSIRWNIKYLTSRGVTEAVGERMMPYHVSLPQMPSLSLARAFRLSVPAVDPERAHTLGMAGFLYFKNETKINQVGTFSNFTFKKCTITCWISHSTQSNCLEIFCAQPSSSPPPTDVQMYLALDSSWAVPQPGSCFPEGILLHLKLVSWLVFGALHCSIHPD